MRRVHNWSVHTHIHKRRHRHGRQARVVGKQTEQLGDTRTVVLSVEMALELVRDQRLGLGAAPRVPNGLSAATYIVERLAEHLSLIHI